MNRKSAGIFPALYGPLIAGEEGRDLFPGVEPAIARIATVFGFHAPKNPFLTRYTLWARRVPGSTIQDGRRQKKSHESQLFGGATRSNLRGGIMGPCLGAHPPGRGNVDSENGMF